MLFSILQFCYCRLPAWEICLSEDPPWISNNTPVRGRCHAKELLSQFSCVKTGSGDSSSHVSTSLGEKLQHGAAAALADLKTLAKHPVYVLNVAGTAVYTGIHPARASTG